MKKHKVRLFRSLSNLYPKEWNVKGCRIVHSSKRAILEFHAHCYPLTPFDCESCGRVDSFTELDFQCRTVTDINAFHLPVKIVLRRRRWRCPCGSSVINTVDHIHNSFKFTDRCIDHIVYTKNFSSTEKLAFELGVSNSTIKNIVTQIKPSELPEEFVAPRYLGIDEIRIKNRRRKKGSGDGKIQYYCVFVDLETGRLIDMIRGKNEKAVSSWLSMLQQKQNIRAIATDFDTTYRNVINDIFPDVIHIIDKFHAMQEVWHALDQVRIKVLKERGIKSFNSSDQIDIRDMLRAKKIDTSDIRWLLLESLLNEHPELRAAYDMKNEFCDIWDGWHHMAIADHLFAKWEDKFSQHSSLIQDCFLTLRLRIFENYADILRYFDFKITNANTERTNRLIRAINRESGGLSFEELRFKARIRTANNVLKKFICDACMSRVKIRERHIEYAMTTKNESVYYGGEFWVCDNCQERHINSSPRMHPDFWIRWSNEWVLPSSRDAHNTIKESFDDCQLYYNDIRILNYLRPQAEKRYKKPDNRNKHKKTADDGQKEFVI